MKVSFARACAFAALAISMLSLQSAHAQVLISDDFEAYAVGDINGQGGPWVDFGGTLTSDVSTTFASSGSQSLKLSVNPIEVANPGYGSDVWAGLDAPISSGKFELGFNLFVPTRFNGINYNFISEGFVGPPDFNFDFGMYLIADGVADVFAYSADVAATAPLVRDAWTPVLAEIDLDNNLVDVYYNGEHLITNTWDVGVEPASLQSINMWAQEGTTGAVYFDDFTLTQVPEPSTGLLGLIGLAGLGLLRRRK